MSNFMDNNIRNKKTDNSEYYRRGKKRIKNVLSKSSDIGNFWRN